VERVELNPRLRARLRKSRAGRLGWPLAVLAVPVHLGLGVLAVVEYARLDWLLFSEPYELTAVTVVAGSAVAAIIAALRVAWLAAQSTRAFRRLLRSAVQPVPASVAAATRGVGHRKVRGCARHRGCVRGHPRAAAAADPA
jgi:hypothetical protein